MDLATEAGRTAAVRLRWEGASITVREQDLLFPASDEEIEAFAVPADVVAVDVPLGWPSAWADAVAAHRPGRDFLSDGGTTAALTWRETDRWVHQRSGKAPQRVAASLLGATAIRGARLTARLARASWNVNPVTAELPDRAVLETYPAAFVALWFPDSALREPDDGPSRRRAVLARLAEAGLTFDGDPAAVTVVDHVYDAMLAAVAAGAAFLGMTPPPPPPLREAAAREGWIRLPVGSPLSELATRLTDAGRWTTRPTPRAT